MQDVFGRSDWFIRHVNQLPDLLLHIRAQALPSPKVSTEPNMPSSREQTKAPMRLEPIDDADVLWREACELASYFAERAHVDAPRVLGNQRVVVDGWGIVTVQGVGAVDARQVYGDALQLCAFLREHAWALTVSPEYNEPVDVVVGTIIAMRRRYPDAPRPARARLRCPVCGQYGVEPDYSEAGELQGLTCGHCGASNELGAEE